MKFSILSIATFLMVAALPLSMDAQDDAAARKGKIAVLPFKYVTNDPSLPADQYGEELQSGAATVLREEAKGLQVQDPLTTNTLLIRNEMTEETIAGYLPGEIAVALGVQYIMFGDFNITNKGTVTTGSSSTSYSEKDKKKSDEGETKKETKGSAYTSTSTTSWTNYDARMEVKIFDDAGQNVYAKSHKPFSADPAEFNATLKYLIRRSPWGKKAGK